MNIKNEKRGIGILLAGIIFCVFLIGIVSAVEASYCCEKTLNGIWCQNSPKEQCDPAYKMNPTQCESSSYCKLGCCYNSVEGTCMENTPERTCNNAGGVWDKSASCDIPQCGLGCCLLGNQAAFVTQTRCNKLAAVYGLEIDFRTDITDEVRCIAAAGGDTEGACTYTTEMKKTCKFITKSECNALAGGEAGGEEGTGGFGEVEFHEGYLCSADELGVDCGPSKNTMCVEGKDEVYFADTCGNKANIYDASKATNKLYWTKIVTKNDSCGYGGRNGGSATCGNCDYLSGSICKKYERSSKMSRPTLGNYACQSLDCEYDTNNDGKIDPSTETFIHGETWCAMTAEGNVKSITIKVADGKITNKEDVSKKSNNLPGSRYFELVCYNGEVTVEPCADFRQEICVQSEINNERTAALGRPFKVAACRVNRWQDCTAQHDDKDKCRDEDKRDCWWKSDTIVGDTCVPLVPPGLNFWVNNSDANNLCSKGSSHCTYSKEKNLFNQGPETGEKCNKDNWDNQVNDDWCIRLGDCGAKLNFWQEMGANKIKDLSKTTTKKRDGTGKDEDKHTTGGGAITPEAPSTGADAQGGQTPNIPTPQIPTG